MGTMTCVTKDANVFPSTCVCGADIVVCCLYCPRKKCSMVGLSFVLPSTLYRPGQGTLLCSALTPTRQKQLQNVGKSSLFTKLRFLAKLPQLLSKETHKIKLSSQHSVAVAEHRSEDGRMEKYCPFADFL